MTRRESEIIGGRRRREVDHSGPAVPRIASRVGEVARFTMPMTMLIEAEDADENDRARADAGDDDRAGSRIVEMVDAPRHCPSGRRCRSASERPSSRSPAEGDLAPELVERTRKALKNSRPYRRTGRRRRSGIVVEVGDETASCGARSRRAGSPATRQSCAVKVSMRATTVHWQVEPDVAPTHGEERLKILAPVGIRDDHRH